MQTLLFTILIIYCIYLNIRIKDIEEELDSCSLDRSDLEVKIYNKMMEIRRELKDEKSGGKPTKKRGRVSKAKISKSKILRKFRGDKDNIQTGGKG